MDPMPSNRVRVSRACDRCKRRKIRCSGTQPCLICIRASAICMYASPYNRGRHRPKPSRPRSSNLMTEHQQLDSHVSTTPVNHQHHGIDEADPSSRVSPAPPIFKDLEGHYVGPASNVSFLIRVQNRLRDCSSPSSPGSSSSELNSTTFTFGDVALAESDTNFCGVMVSQEETSSMLCHYFDFTVPMDQFLHRPTIEVWLREFHETMAVMRSTPDAPARRAVLWMIFCMGVQKHTSTESTDVGERKSVQYFLAAEYQLSKERGAVSLASVQARLCQCLWLLSQSRLNHCWDLFGTTARLAMALGFHRRSIGSDLSSGCSPVEIEFRRRTFWSAYCLDNYLSITMGRPRIFHDDDIDQEMPSSTDEGDLQPGQPSPQGGWSHSTMVAPIAYFKLSRLVSHILRDIYSIKPSSMSDRSACAEQYSASLKEWRAELPQFLNTENREAAPLIPIFYRQRIMLNLAYWHTILLTNRLFLLSAFSAVSMSASSQRPRSRSLDSNRDNREGEQISRVAQIEAKIADCLGAAMNIVDTFNELVQMGWILRSFWLTNSFAFSAVVVLYVYTIQQSCSAPEVFQAYFAAATRCEGQLLSFSQHRSLTRRYCLILEELRLEVVRRVETPRPLTRESQTQCLQAPCDLRSVIEAESNTLVAGEDMNRVMDAGSIPLTFSDLISSASPGRWAELGEVDLDSSMADVSSWVQFDSLANFPFGDFRLASY